jgi:hypothetical protein
MVLSPAPTLNKPRLTPPGACRIRPRLGVDAAAWNRLRPAGTTSPVSWEERLMPVRHGAEDHQRALTSRGGR